MLPMEVSATSKEQNANSLDRRPMVQVEAPCNMEAGYTFMATHDGFTFPVQVPPGGVRKGQVFTTPFSCGDLTGLEARGDASEGTFLLWPAGRQLTGTASAMDPDAAPPGKWKSSLFDCLRHGPCHPSLWNALCCPQLLVAQVLTRLKLDWWGDPTTDPQRTFPWMLGLVATYWALTIWLAPERGAGKDWNSRDHRPASTWLRVAAYNALFAAFGMYTWWILAKARRAVRRRRAISAVRGGGCDCGGTGAWEDACVSLWCGCCAAAQLARETADYDAQPASCCSRTGLTHQSAGFPASVLTV